MAGYNDTSTGRVEGECGCKNGRNAQCETQGMHAHKGRVLNGLEECSESGVGGGLCCCQYLVRRRREVFSRKRLSRLSFANQLPDSPTLWRAHRLY